MLAHVSLCLHQGSSFVFALVSLSTVTVTSASTSSHFMGRSASHPASRVRGLLRICGSYWPGYLPSAASPAAYTVEGPTYTVRCLDRQVLRRYRYQALQQDGSLFRTSQKRVLRRLSYLSPQLTKELLFRQPLLLPRDAACRQVFLIFLILLSGGNFVLRFAVPCAGAALPCVAIPAWACLPFPYLVLTSLGLPSLHPAALLHCCCILPPILSFPYRSLSFPHSLDIFSDIPTLGNFDAQPSPPSIARPPAARQNAVLDPSPPTHSEPCPPCLQCDCSCTERD